MDEKELSSKEKREILQQGFDECIKNHLCGNYLGFHDYEDILQMDSYDIEWYVDKDTLTLVANTEYGLFFTNYDFDFSFDSNLICFYEELLEFLIDESQKSKFKSIHNGLLETLKEGVWNL